MATTGTFGVWDYVVLGIVLLISASIGVYFRFTGGKQKTTLEYLMGNRSLTAFPVSCSLMASFMSAIALLGISSENYNYGTQFVTINLSYGIATPIAAYCYLPVFFKLQNTSAYEYLEMRFGSWTRLTASLAFTLQMTLYTGVVLYAPALALEAITGLSKEGAILAVGAVCTFYSTIGGMKAVVLTDVFQTLLMFMAIFMVIIKGTIDAGGLGEVWRIAEEGHRIEFDNISLDPTQRYTWWTQMIGGTVAYLSVYAVNQAQVQRLLSLRNLKSSQNALWISWPVLSALSISTSFAGLVLYSKYYKCDPKTAGRISSPDQLMPLFVVDNLGDMPGLAGLFAAGIFSGSLSTVSSSLNSLAAITLEDYIKPAYAYVKGTPLAESRTGLISKLVALGYGLVCIVMAFLSQHLGGLLQASLTIFGVIGGPLFGVFTLGMFFTFCNEAGAIGGLLFGLATALWIGFGGPKAPAPKLPMSTEGCDNANSSSYASHLMDFAFNSSTIVPPTAEEQHYFYLYRISYTWYIVIGFCTTVFAGCIVSLICIHCRKTTQRPTNPELFTPFVKYFLLKNKNYQHGGLVPSGDLLEIDGVLSESDKKLPSSKEESKESATHNL